MEETGPQGRREGARGRREKSARTALQVAQVRGLEPNRLDDLVQVGKAPLEACDRLQLMGLASRALGEREERPEEHLLRAQEVYVCMYVCVCVCARANEAREEVHRWLASRMQTHQVRRQLLAALQFLAKGMCLGGVDRGVAVKGEGRRAILHIWAERGLPTEVRPAIISDCRIDRQGAQNWAGLVARD